MEIRYVVSHSHCINLTTLDCGEWFQAQGSTSFTLRGAIGDLFNATSLNILFTEVTDDYSDYIALFKTAKEICDCRKESLEGDEAIQTSRVAFLKQEVDLFVRNDVRPLMRCIEG